MKIKTKYSLLRTNRERKKIEPFHRYMKKHVLVNVELHVLDFINASFSLYFSAVYI